MDLLATLAESEHGRAAVARVRTLPRIIAAALAHAARTPHDHAAAEVAAAAARVAAASLLCRDGRAAAKARGRPMLEAASALRASIDAAKSVMEPEALATLPTPQALKALERDLASLV